MTNNELKFIYLDVGGVVILDFSKTSKWEEMLHDMGIGESNREGFEKLFEEYEKEICKGLDLNVFVERATSELGLKLTKDYSMLKDFVNRFEVNKKIHPLIFEIKKKYPIGLLTNMYPGMYTEIEAQNLLPDIEWNVIVDSSIEKCMKPEARIYEIAEQRANVKPENIFYVDNSSTHLEAAKERGWQTMLYDPSDVDASNQNLRNILLLK